MGTVFLHDFLILLCVSYHMEGLFSWDGLLHTCRLPGCVICGGSFDRRDMTALYLRSLDSIVILFLSPCARVLIPPLEMTPISSFALGAFCCMFAGCRVVLFAAGFNVWGMTDVPEIFRLYSRTFSFSICMIPYTSARDDTHFVLCLPVEGGLHSSYYRLFSVIPIIK